eukprot:TRINITY_DN3800_c0_g1_i1.p1 TRINITY_DN3800_c0_g1~~TRINITY_DN3800_c0_g1_i1.p1  ORF type:complete len:555 (-),score=106.22 TRINITY_DN3800_c0_g1_i1:110-1774(-)
MVANTKLFVTLACFVLVMLLVEAKPFEKGTHGGHQTNHWAVKLHRGADPEVVARKHGMKNLGHVVNDIYVFHKPEESEVAHEHISSHPDVAWAKVQVAKRRFKRTITANDPLFANQWNLREINVESAWLKGFRGTNITIAVVDDGLETTHPEFKGKYRPDLSYDFNYEDPDPTPFDYDGHGTEAAGAAGAAANNTLCGVGVAPEAGISGIRLIADYTTDAMEARALAYKIQENDIFSCSWGPDDDGMRLEAPEEITSQAIADAIQNGRGGKGTIYVWAAGNGLAHHDSCAYDGYASNKFAITIGAVDMNEKEPFYSEKCAALMAVTPSSGITGYSVVATGLHGGCVSTFGGTSAACPQAAGAIALLLSARPDLTWRDVQAVIAKTSTQINVGDTDWVINGGGYHHSHKYGFGLINIEAMIREAATYELLPPYVALETSSGSNSQGADSRSGTLTSTITVTPADNFIVEHIEVNVNMRCSNRGKIDIQLKSPAGTLIQLQDDHPDTDANIRWTYVVKRTFGERATGTWTLLYRNPLTTSAYLDEWNMVIYGHNPQ